MSRLVEDLLTLARAGGGMPLRGSTVDMGELAHEICRKAGAQHPDRNIHCAGPPIVLRASWAAEPRTAGSRTGRSPAGRTGSCRWC